MNTYDNSIYCGVTLSSQKKGDILKAGFFDSQRNEYYIMNIKENKIVFLLMGNSIDDFKKSYVFVFPISLETWEQIKSIKKVKSLNYKKIASMLELNEWII